MREAIVSSPWVLHEFTSRRRGSYKESFFEPAGTRRFMCVKVFSW